MHIIDSWMTTLPFMIISVPFLVVFGFFINYRVYGPLEKRISELELELRDVRVRLSKLERPPHNM
jgi:hypothetical protein